MKRYILKAFLTIVFTLSITACNKTDATTNEITQEILVQESMTEELVEHSESSFQTPEITGEEEMQAREKLLNDEIKAHITNGNADFHFEENQYLAINGSLFDVPGLALFDEEMELHTFIYDIEFESSLDIQMVDITKPLILVYDKVWGTDDYVDREIDRKKGVYMIEDQEWKIKPLYGSVDLLKDGTYRTYGNGILTVLDLEGNVILRDSELRLEGNVILRDSELRIGDRIWDIVEAKRRAKIYDLSGQFIKDFIITGDADYAYEMDGFYKVVYSPDTEILYDKDGELVFSRQDIPADVVANLNLEDGLEVGADCPFSIEKISRDGSLIGFKYNEAAMVFDLNNKVLLTQPEEKAYINEHDSIVSYTVYNEEGNVVYYQDGTPIMSQTNISYSMVVGNGCYAYQNGGFLVIDDTESQETCRIKLETEIDSAEQVIPGLYLLKSDSGNSGNDYLYQGDQLIKTSNEMMYYKLSNYKRIAVYCYDYEGDGNKLVGSYVFDQNGNLLYLSTSHWPYYLITDQFLVYPEGPIIYVFDYYNGNIAMTLEQ